MLDAGKLEEGKASLTGSTKTSKSYAHNTISQYLSAMQVKYVINDTVDGKVVDLHLPE